MKDEGRHQYSMSDIYQAEGMVQCLSVGPEARGQETEWQEFSTLWKKIFHSVEKS